MGGWTSRVYPGWQHQPLNKPFCPPWQRWSGRAMRLDFLEGRPETPEWRLVPRDVRPTRMREFRVAVEAWAARPKIIQVWAWTRSGCECKLSRRLAEVQRAYPPPGN